MMELTPLDVRKKREDLGKRFRGYDVQEVDSFLELVAERLEELVRENRTLRDRLEGLSRQVESQERRERAVQEALVTAQEIRDEIREQARREAELIRREAEAEVERLLREGERAVEELETSHREAQRRRQRFLRSYRSFLEKELDGLDAEETQELSAVPTVPSERSWTDRLRGGEGSGAGALEEEDGPRGEAERSREMGADLEPLHSTGPTAAEGAGEPAPGSEGDPLEGGRLSDAPEPSPERPGSVPGERGPSAGEPGGAPETPDPAPPEAGRAPADPRPTSAEEAEPDRDRPVADEPRAAPDDVSTDAGTDDPGAPRSEPAPGQAPDRERGRRGESGRRLSGFDLDEFRRPDL